MKAKNGIGYAPSYIIDYVRFKLANDPVVSELNKSMQQYSAAYSRTDSTAGAEDKEKIIALISAIDRWYTNPQDKRLATIAAAESDYLNRRILNPATPEEVVRGAAAATTLLVTASFIADHADELDLSEV